jgi:hypothetical protein
VAQLASLLRIAGGLSDCAAISSFASAMTMTVRLKDRVPATTRGTTDVLSDAAVLNN